MAKIEKELERAIKSRFKLDQESYLQVGRELASFCRSENLDRMKQITPDVIERFCKTSNLEKTKSVCDRIFNQARFERYERDRTTPPEKNTKNTRKSLALQLHERMQELNRIGQTKHDKKIALKTFANHHKLSVNPLKNDGIYSFNTYDSYKQTSIEFTRWIRNTHASIKKIDQITIDHAKEYLLFRQNQNLSKWTVDKDMAALNKVLGFEMTKKEVGLHRKSYTETVRSRREAKMDRHFNPENYKDQITMAKATGIRRQSMTRITPSDFTFQNNITTHLTVKEKGGKVRTLQILDTYREEVTAIVLKSMEQKGAEEKVFDSYTKKIDNHAFRGEYARNLYEQLIQEQGFEHKDCKGYDSKILKKVSQNLGHERIAIVVQHYLR